MKRLILTFILGLIVLTVTACKHQGEEKITSGSKGNVSDVIKSVYVDDEFGDNEMEVIINKMNNTVTIHFEGETHELKKVNELPNYTAEDAEYKYSDIKGEITLLRKDFDMVIFHHEPEPRKTKSAGMASY